MANILDCLSAGIVVADTVCQPIAKMPPPGALIKTDRIEFSIGGCSANVAVDMSRLGFRVGLSGRVGQDLFGREVRDRLSASGVDVTQLEMSPTTPTSSTFVLNVKDEDRRFIHCVGANGEYDGLEVTDEAIRCAKVLFVGGFGLLDSLTSDRLIRLFRMARENGVVTALNVAMSHTADMSTWLKPALPWTDLFFCNSDEARLMTSQTEPLHQAEALHALGAKTVVVTQGDRGAVLVGINDRLRAGVYPVEPIDGTGTGDAFVAGFLYGVLKGLNVRECLKFGTALGASCVRSMGATTGVFCESELIEFVQANSLAIESI